MKQIAALALLGAVSAVSLERLTNQEKLYIQVSDLEDEMNVQTGKVLENLPNFDGWHPDMHEFPGTVNEYGNYMDGYNRQLPDVFVGDAADVDHYPVDKFTQNMIQNYAVEGIDGKKEKDPKPTGSFYLTKEAARRASVEVLCTHFKKCGADAETFLTQFNRYNECWDYYDVNKTGRIDAIGVSQFFRYLTTPLGPIDLQ